MVPEMAFNITASLKFQALDSCVKPASSDNVVLSSVRFLAGLGLPLPGLTTAAGTYSRGFQRYNGSGYTEAL